MDFTKKKSILVNLITSTEFNDSLEWKGAFIRLIKGIWEVREVLTQKTVRIRPRKCKLCHFEPICISIDLTLLLPDTLITHFKVCQICYQTNPTYSMSSWTKLHLNGLEIELIIHFKRGQRPTFHMWPSRPFLFQPLLSHCGLLYFHLLYNISN